MFKSLLGKKEVVVVLFSNMKVKEVRRTQKKRGASKAVNEYGRPRSTVRTTCMYIYTPLQRTKERYRVPGRFNSKRHFRFRHALTQTRVSEKKKNRNLRVGKSLKENKERLRSGHLEWLLCRRHLFYVRVIWQRFPSQNPNN